MSAFRSLWGSVPLLLFAQGAGALVPQRPDPGTTPGATADTLVLDLAEARRLASRQNPYLLSRRREAEAARGRLRQARVYSFNPEVSLRSVEVGGGRTLRAYEGEISQELEWAGSWGIRAAVAEREAEREALLADDAGRQTLSAVATLFLSALAAQERLRLAEELQSMNDRIVSAAKERLEAGEISQLEMNLARIEGGRAKSWVLAEGRNARTAVLELRHALALEEGRPLRFVSDLPPAPDPATLDGDSLVRVALARRPDAGARRADLAASQPSARLAGRERWPNLLLSVPFEKPEGAGQALVGVAIGLSVPLWNRNQGRRDEARAVVARARAELDDAELQVRRDVQDALQRYASASAEERLAAEEVRDPARANQALLEEAFRSGKIDLPTLLLVRNQLLDAELSYWDSWLQLRTELVLLDAATAEPTTDDPQRGS
ncbi:MAG: TolC family protein [Gemmatimonadetes bacterium]|nr:TolC family protein [Gemmatimonadota bacterium]